MSNLPNGKVILDTAVLTCYTRTLLANHTCRQCLLFMMLEQHKETTEGENISRGWRDELRGVTETGLAMTPQDG